MTTYPNQKVLHINKPNYENAYLSVGIDEWIEASKNLKPITFKIYLYLCGNKDGFNLALSRQDVMNKLGISKNSYINGIDELEEKGYIIHKQGNIYDFYATPMYQSSGTLDDGIYQPSGTVCTNTVVHDVPIDEYSMYQSNGTEISKTSKISNLSNKTLTLREELEERDDAVLNEMLSWYKKGKDNPKEYGYISMKKYFNIENKLDSDLGKIIKDILSTREYKRQQEKAIESAYMPLYCDNTIDFDEAYRRGKKHREEKEKEKKKDIFISGIDNNEKSAFELALEKEGIYL